jgi:hypothetical protein
MALVGKIYEKCEEIKGENVKEKRRMEKGKGDI